MVGVTAVGTATGTAPPSSITADRTTGMLPGTVAITVRVGWRITERAITQLLELLRVALRCRTVTAQERRSSLQPLDRNVRARCIRVERIRIRRRGSGIQSANRSVRVDGARFERVRECRGIDGFEKRQYRLQSASDKCQRNHRASSHQLTVAQLTVHRERTVTARLSPKQRMATSTRPPMETPTRTPEVAGREIRTILRNTTRAKLHRCRVPRPPKGWGGQEKSGGSSAWGGGGGGGWQSRSESARGAQSMGGGGGWGGRGGGGRRR